MSRKIIVLIIVLAVAAIPVFSQQQPLSVGALIGAGLVGDLFPGSAELSLRYSLMDWLSVRVDAGCLVIFTDVINDTYFWPEMAGGVMMEPFAGFYVKLMGGMWIMITTGDPHFFPVANLGVGFDIGGFFAELEGVLLIGQEVFPWPFCKIGYRFTL